jgi:chorismate-pyruvate lyase
LVIAIPLIVAAVSFILSKTALKNNKKVLTIAQRALGEYTFMGLMFVAYSVTVSLAL